MLTILGTGIRFLGIPFRAIDHVTIFLTDMHIELGWVTPLTKYSVLTPLARYSVLTPPPLARYSVLT